MIPHGRPNRDFAARTSSIDRLLNHARCAALLTRYNRDYVTQKCRAALDQCAADIRQGKGQLLNDDAILDQVEGQIELESRPVHTRVVNASGVVIHTNLGRAVLAREAVDALAAAASGATTIEFDLATGTRGDRDAHIEGHLCALTGAEAATVVNNNAAAVLLALNTLAEGREVVISRGELVEIGGSFRIPEILAKSGARLREVGTTNRTHARDYERAIGPDTALILKVHTSNYRVVGFTAAVELAELVRLGAARQVPVMEDLGSGALIDLTTYGLPHEPVVADSVRAGVDVVTFSGDKLLGGPQAGLLVGRRDAIEAIRRNPLKRALRCDKLTLAALDATLRRYRQSPNIVDEIPTLRAFTRSVDEVRAMGQSVMPKLETALGKDFQLALQNSASWQRHSPTEELPRRQRHRQTI